MLEVVVGPEPEQRDAMLATLGTKVFTRTDALPPAQNDLSQNDCNKSWVYGTLLEGGAK